MEIKALEPKDLPKILEYITQEFPYYNVDHEKLAKKHSNPQFIFLKAVEEGKVQGFVELEVYEPYKKFARINGIVIDKSARRKGIGQTLLQAAVDLAHEMDMRLVTMLVEKDNTIAKKLYDKVGFSYMMDLETKVNNKDIEEWEIILRRENQLMYMQ